ncbi:MAG: FAD-dependent oxidoreductase [Bacilli bacterium]|jgi:thioredoxin reductase (NADPH)|nr:FAD-dependent oxidoreductase [Bacilli bacterium]
MENHYEVIIVGAGPGGLSAAVYAGRSEMKTLIIERGAQGGRVKDTLEVSNYLGAATLSGPELVEHFYQHALSFPSVSLIRTTVTGVKKDGDIFTVSTKRRGDFTADSVILALGTEPRVLGLAGEKEYFGRGVHYCATCDGAFYKDKEVYVLGAGDQAIEEGDFLTRFAKKVHIIVIHEEGHVDANQLSFNRIKENPKIDFIWNSTLDEVLGDGNKVVGLKIKNVKSGEIKEVSADAIFSFVGMVPNTGMVRDLVKVDRNGYIYVDETKATSLSGLYAIGDCTVTYLRQIIVAASDGAIAATAVERYLKEVSGIKRLLDSKSGKVAFIFYSPYDQASLSRLGQEEKVLSEQGYTVYRQDISRQHLLYDRLAIKEPFAVTKYINGKKESD